VLCLHSRGGTEDNQEDLVRMALLRLIQPLRLTHDSYSRFTIFTPMKALFQSGRGDGYSGRGVTLTTHLHLLLMSRMSRVIR